jgi:hypothetical protein
MLVTAAEACAVVVVLVSVIGAGGQVRSAANGATGSLTTATSAWPFVAALGAALATAGAIAIAYSTRPERGWSARSEAGGATRPAGASEHEGPEPIGRDSVGSPHRRQHVGSKVTTSGRPSNRATTPPPELTNRSPELSADCLTKARDPRPGG